MHRVFRAHNVRPNFTTRDRIVDFQCDLKLSKAPGGAYYLMSLHEHVPPQARGELKEVGWTKGTGTSHDSA